MSSESSELPPDILASELHKIEERAVRKLKARFQLSLQELTFASLLFDYPSFPVHLETRREKFTWDSFFRNPFKQPVWLEYMSVLAEREGAYAGIIVRSGDVQGRLLILHSRWRAEAVPGRLRLVIRANDEDGGTLIEEFDDFLDSIALSWEP